MANDNRLEIEIVLDDGSVRKGFAKIEREAEGSLGRISEIALGVFGGQQLVKLFDTVSTAAKDFLKGAVAASAEAEVNLNRLNNAMKLAGAFSEDASKSMQKFADDIQRTTTIEDDAAIGMLAFARNITRSNEEAVKLTKAAIEMGAALGTGPEAALQQLNMTLDGSIGRLGKQIPALKQYTEAQLRAGAAVDYVLGRFGGAAANELNTFSGSIKQLENIWGNLKETVGGFVTNSKSVTVVIKSLSELIANMTTRLQNAFGGSDIFRDFLINMSAILQASIETGRRIALSFELAFLRAKQAWASFKVLTTAGFSDAFNRQLMEINQQIDDTKAAFSQDSAATTYFDSLIQKLSDTRNEITKLTKGNGDGGSIPEIAESFLQLGSGPVSSLEQAMNNFEIGWRMSTQRIADDARKAFRDQGAAAFQTLVGGVSSGMAAIGKALVKGENLFQAFGGAMLGAIGQALMAEGAARILQGVARAFSSYGLDPTAQGLIATGSAMSVAGGAMAALGSGVGGGAGIPSASGAGAGGLSPSMASEGINPSESIKDEKSARVTVNIQGDVLDSRETGLRIVELINDAGFNSDSKVFA